MERINNPHDRYFKRIFSDKEVARSFVVNYLPEEIQSIVDILSLELDYTHLVNKNLEELISDVLYKFKVKGSEDEFFYILIEHKSQIDRYVSVQLSKYAVEIQDKGKHNNHIPEIFSATFYHGKRKWNAGTRLSDLIRTRLPDKFKEYQLDFKFFLVDTADYTDNEFKGITRLQLALILFKHIFDSILKLEKVLLDNVTKFKEILEIEKDQDYIISCITYILSREIKVEKIYEIFNTYVSKEGGVLVMSTAEKLRREGLEEGLIKTAKNMLREGYNEKSIAKVTELPLAEVQKLKQEMESNR